MIMQFDTSLDMWKQGVSRATAFIQSNGSFQVQIAGFFFSAVAISIATVRPENQAIMFLVFIPVFSLIMLFLSASYFNFLAIQQAFISVYGRRYEAGQKILCHEDFRDYLKNHHRIGIAASTRYMMMPTYYGTPYFKLFWLYIAASQLSLWDWMRVFMTSGDTIFFAPRATLWLISVAASISFLMIQVAFTAWMTTRACCAIDYEYKVIFGGKERY